MLYLEKYENPKNQFRYISFCSIIRNLLRIFARMHASFKIAYYYNDKNTGSILVGTTISTLFTISLGIIVQRKFNIVLENCFDIIVYNVLFIFMGLTIGYSSQLLITIMSLMQRARKAKYPKQILKPYFFIAIPLMYMSIMMEIVFMSTFDFANDSLKNLTFDSKNGIIYFLTVLLDTLLILIMTFFQCDMDKKAS